MTINNATTWALAVFDSDMKPAQKLICLYLRTHMNDYREAAWPSVARIAGKCSLSVRAVQGHLKEIQAAGYLMNNGHSPSGTVRYAICTPAESAPPQKTTLPPAESAPELTKELTNTLSKGFKPPSVGEVAEYCRERGNSVDPETFVDWNASKGWMIGKNKMKDWKAAVRTWEKREKQNGYSNGNSGSVRQHGKSTVADRLRADIAALEG